MNGLLVFGGGFSADEGGRFSREVDLVLAEAACLVAVGLLGGGEFSAGGGGGFWAVVLFATGHFWCGGCCWLFLESGFIAGGRRCRGQKRKPQRDRDVPRLEP